MFLYYLTQFLTLKVDPKMSTYKNLENIFQRHLTTMLFLQNRVSSRINLFVLTASLEEGLMRETGDTKLRCCVRNLSRTASQTSTWNNFTLLPTTPPWTFSTEEMKCGLLKCNT